MTKDIRKERINGQIVWGVNVSFDETIVRRYYYATRQQAQHADISDGIGDESGKIRSRAIIRRVYGRAVNGEDKA